MINGDIHIINLSGYVRKLYQRVIFGNFPLPLLLPRHVLIRYRSPLNFLVEYKCIRLSLPLPMGKALFPYSADCTIPFELWL